MWHSYGFWHERISEYIRVKKMTRMNIQIYSYEHFWYERISEYIRIKTLLRTNIRINIWIENIRIFEYIRHTLYWRIKLEYYIHICYPQKYTFKYYIKYYSQIYARKDICDQLKNIPLLKLNPSFWHLPKFKGDI